MTHRAARADDLQTALRKALEKGELFALYQPQVSTGSGRVVGAEALLRWRRPGRGVIAPDAFVPFAEGHGLIDPLGVFMLEHACRAASGWSDLRISINVSPLQFARRDIADFISGVAERAGLPLARLEIEITENAPFPDMGAAKAALADMRRRGVTVSLDDLGSGLATPCLMENLPLDRVKLAREVVETCGAAEGAEKVRALVAHARRLGLGVTAEGVETQEEFAFLRACGCDLIQGFFFAPPMTGPELETFAGKLGR